MTLRFGKTDFLNNITTRRRTAVVFYFNLVISFLNTYNAAFLVVVIHRIKGLVLDYEPWTRDWGCKLKARICYLEVGTIRCTRISEIS